MTDQVARAKRFRIVVAGMFGNVLEWYDFALFGYFAPVIGRLFFPSENPIASLLQTYGVFALGYFVRPLGGVLFGHIGDRLGRKSALQLSVLLMAVPTTLVALLPTFATIGIWAPLLLVVLRLAQGLSVGGELIGSISFLGEHARVERRGLFTSFSFVSANLGILLGSAAAALVNRWVTGDAFAEWGWRLPFLMGIAVGLVGFWMRRGVEESEVFERASASGELTERPIIHALKHERWPILVAFCLTIPVSVGFYVPFVWMSTWLTDLHDPPLADALTVNTIALLALVVMIPFAGMLSDRIGRKTVFVTGALGAAVLAYPLFVVISRATFEAALLGQLGFAVCAALAIGAAAPTFVELFPTATRYSGVAIGYNVAQSTLGGTAPLIATWLLSQSGSFRGPAIYFIACMIPAILVGRTIHGRHREVLR